MRDAGQGLFSFHRSCPVVAYNLPLGLEPYTAQARPASSRHASSARTSGVSTARDVDQKATVIARASRRSYGGRDERLNSAQGSVTEGRRVGSRVSQMRRSWNGWWNARIEKPGRRTDEYIGALPRRGGLFCEWGGMTSLKYRWDRGRGVLATLRASKRTY
jgi:hypothetical protein